MKSSIYVKRQSFEVRLNSVISFVFVAFCQPRILRYSARDVTDIFAEVSHSRRSSAVAVKADVGVTVTMDNKINRSKQSHNLY